MKALQVVALLWFQLKKNGIKAVGNEGQELLYNVIKGKLDWSVDISKITRFLTQLERDLDNGTYKDNYHELLKTLYSESDLYQLYFIRDYISKNVSDERLTYFKLGPYSIIAQSKYTSDRYSVYFQK